MPSFREGVELFEFDDHSGVAVADTRSGAIIILSLSSAQIYQLLQSDSLQDDSDIFSALASFLH